MSMPREVLRIGCSAARSWSGRPRDAARPAARPGSGGEVRTRRTTRRVAGSSWTSSASRPGRSAAKSRMCAAASAGYCASPCLTSVCQPEHQRCTGRVAVSTTVRSWSPSASTSSGRSSSTARSRLSLDSSSVPVPRPAAVATTSASLGPFVAAQRVPRSGPGQVRGPALGEGHEQRPEQVVMTGRPVPPPGVPHVLVLGVGSAPARLHRRRPGLVQARVEDDLHPPDRRGTAPGRVRRARPAPSEGRSPRAPAGR